MSQTVTSLAEFCKFVYEITKIDSRSRRKGFPTLTLIVIAGDTTYLMLSGGGGGINFGTTTLSSFDFVILGKSMD